jgi:hypothetical protein
LQRWLAALTTTTTREEKAFAALLDLSQVLAFP